MSLEINDLLERAKEYVEIEARSKVLSAEFAESFTLFGNEDIAISIKIEDKEDPDWWVIGGSTPINLYTKRLFKSADEAFSFHAGITMRMFDRNFEHSEEIPKDLGYDAFISHATEDKVSLVRPLAKRLSNMGYRIWYDEFELRVGDSLRESIDKGLVNSTYGIVVLSKAFFEKNWPQYELNGLTAKEMGGKKVVLPIWHQVTRDDVLKYSPPLADKVALDTSKLKLNRLANELAKVLFEE